MVSKIIAVTGGAGFLGSHLCDALYTQGHEIICIDNFHTGRRANVARLIGQKGFTLVDHDITEPLPSSLPKFDEIYNLACPASPIHYQADAVQTALICAQGTLNILERAKRDGAKMFQASTSEIYGDPDIHPQSEDYFGNVNPVGPRSCYDEGKRFAETLVTDFARQNSLRAKIVRIFNTYGPRMQPDDGRVVSNFIIQALNGDDITVYGDGSQTRSFCYVDDLIDGFIKLMNSGDDVIGPVNLGNPAEITVSELADVIVSMTGTHSGIVYRPLPVDDPRRRKPNIAKARKHLSWSPKVDLRIGLGKTISYFSELVQQNQLQNAMRERRFAHNGSVSAR